MKRLFELNEASLCRWFLLILLVVVILMSSSHKNGRLNLVCGMVCHPRKNLGILYYGGTVCLLQFLKNVKTKKETCAIYSLVDKKLPKHPRTPQKCSRSVHWSITNVSWGPNWCRHKLKYRTSLATFLTSHEMRTLITSAW